MGLVLSIEGPCIRPVKHQSACTNGRVPWSASLHVGAASSGAAPLVSSLNLAPRSNPGRIKKTLRLAVIVITAFDCTANLIFLTWPDYHQQPQLSKANRSTFVAEC